MSIIHTFFIKIIFLFSFSIISYLPPPNPSFFLIHNTLISINSRPLFLLLLSFFLFLFCFCFFFLFLRIFFFPLLLLQFEFYAFIIDNDFGMGLIKGSDFGRRKQKFWVEKMVILNPSTGNVTCRMCQVYDWGRRSWEICTLVVAATLVAAR